MDRAVALEALRKANEVFGRLHLRYWLDCGSLLGAVRHGDIIPWDLDVDFSTWDHHRHEEIHEEMLVAGFEPYQTHGTPERGYEQRFSWKGVHVDLFYFYEGTAEGPEEGTCWQGSWDRERLIESRFPADIVRQTVPFTFKRITVPVPVEYEAMLVARYDDWLRREKKWNWRTDPRCITKPKASRDVTFLIKTFLRPKLALRAVRSVRSTYRSARVLVVDDSDISTYWEEMLRESGAEVLRLPYDVGLSAGRNAGVKKIDTTFTVVIDDDMIVGRKTNVPSMLRLLDEADVVCGSMRQNGRIINWEGNYEFTEDGGLRLVPSEFEGKLRDGIRCVPVEFGLNILAVRTEFLRTHPWDEELKLSEHTSWFLGLKDEGAKVLFAPDSVVDHKPVKDPQYRKFRRRPEFRLRFFAKHGFKYHIGYTGHRDEWTKRDQEALERLRGG